jgi:chromatin modification-related protein VID21
MRRAAKRRAEAAQKVLSELPLPTRIFLPFTKHDPTANLRKGPATHETHNQINKLPKLTPMDLGRMKAEKDARESQELAMARQRQSEQVRQNILMREQAQRAATIPVRNLLLFRLV